MSDPTTISEDRKRRSGAMSPLKRTLLRASGGLLLLYIVLMIPLPEPIPEEVLSPPAGKPFVWAQDSVWYRLEDAFVSAREAGCTGVQDRIEDLLVDIDIALNVLDAGEAEPDDPRLTRLEGLVFSLAPLVAGCPDYAEEYMWRVVRMRTVVKGLSMAWDMNDRGTREVMYRLLYGSRASLEEVVLQIPDGLLPATINVYDEPSVTPSETILGVTIHSGDILVSRGGAPTSALIARGNDFPGNFSHVALVYIDEETRTPVILESHIECGVVRSTLEEYLKDKKLRVMVMRLRSDLPALVREPMLPHHAASLAFEDARNRHIPYDFAMDYSNPDKLFCSEVASAAYGWEGVNLWMGMSTISSRGLRSWLAAFGVRYFVTQEPSDLEYDPQLTVVAEWRDPETLYKDHIDNAVTEVMLEGAERGEELEADVWMLPIARTMKLYSWVLNRFGAVGPIPEGMDAMAALKNATYSDRHDALTACLLKKADTFLARHHYRPPYWRMVEMARECVAEEGSAGD